MALARNKRIRSEADIHTILKKGKTVQGSFFFLKTMPVGKSGARGVVIVSSKVAKTAVLRNRVKRILGEVLRQHIARGVRTDIICMVTKSFPLDSQIPRQELARALQKV